ncbi:MAG TPA: hypothetical protein VFZ47_07460 [Chitinophagaceae bacterium]
MTTSITRMTAFKKFIDLKWHKTVSKTATLLILFLILTPCSFAQTAKDTTDNRFYDDLLDHMVGKWGVSATVYGHKFTLNREVEWVMNHQYVRIYEKSREIIPWLKVAFERTIFIGYNHRSKRYLVYELTVHGGDGPIEPEGFSYGVRTGNELKVVLKGPEIVIHQTFTWEPSSESWHFQGRRLIEGKEQEPHVDQKAVRVKTSSK